VVSISLLGFCPAEIGALVTHHTGVLVGSHLGDPALEKNRTPISPELSRPLSITVPSELARPYHIEGDQKVSMHLMIAVQKTRKNILSMKMTITEYIRNVDRAMLNTVFENTVRLVNKCLETGGGHFKHYL
jgi:hypothetical protein